MKSIQVYEGDGVKSHPRIPKPKPDQFILSQADWELITVIGNGQRPCRPRNKYAQARCDTAYDTCRMIHDREPNTVPKPYLLRRMRRLGILLPYVAEQYKRPLLDLITKLPPAKPRKRPS